MGCASVQMTLDGQRYYDATCKWCGKRFNKTYHTQKYCSDTCRQEAVHEQKRFYDEQHREKIAVCKYCGKPFEKSHGHEMYCSDKCREQVILESAAKYQRKRRKQINNGHLVSNENRHVGTNYLSQHRREDFDEEQAAIQKEMKRLKLR